MSVALEIIPVPLGNQLTSTIGNNEPEDKNDFRILLVFTDQVTGLTEDDITLSTGASLVSLKGRNSVWEATIRPPETAGTVRVTVGANAVTEGNTETSKDIRVSTSFPDTDAETPTDLFSHGFPSNPWGASQLAVTPTHIYITRRTSNRVYTPNINLKKFTHAGVEDTTVNFGVVPAFGAIEYLNGDFWLHVSRTSNSSVYRRFRETASGLIQTDESISFNHSGADITYCRLGYIFAQGASWWKIKSFDTSEETTQNFGVTVGRGIDHDDDLIYANSSGFQPALLEIGDDDRIRFVRRINIKVERDIKIYRDTLYHLTTSAVQTLDIRKYRPMAKNMKTTIYPVFATAGDKLNLTQFAPDAERIVFDIGFDKPSYLSINASNELVIGSGAKTCLVRLKAINRIDATETGSFQFYLIIQKAASPVWRDVSELTMRAGSSVNLFNYVRDAASIAFRSGKDRLTGSRLSNGVFTIDTVGGVSHFTARNGNGSTHIEITIDVVQRLAAEAYSDIFRYRVEVAGIDVTHDLTGFPSVSETLDPVVINEYRVNEASIVLRNEEGKYNSAIAGNFWETNGLNAGGFQDGVKIWTEHWGAGTWVENLLFTGVINESFEPMGEATFKLNCVDISSRLRKALVQDFGTLEKWDALRKQSDEDSYQGVYVPEPSLSPMQVGTGVARSDRTDLEISRLELPSEGPPAANTGYMTATEFRTAGGFLQANPLLRFKAAHRSEDVRFLIHQLATNKEVYNTEIDIPGVTVANPFLLNRGSVASGIEKTRTSVVPVDWVYDSTNNRVLILLSNPETHIADVLVQYDVAGDSYRVLHTFDKSIAVHRIERRSGTNYYILTSVKIAQNRSASTLPRTSDTTAYAYDSAAEGSAIKIYHYSTSTGTLTKHVDEDDSFPPQLGLHYHVGFENSLYMNTFEGIRPDYRGAFRWHSNNLYYRYAKDGEFGVARVDAAGTVSKQIESTQTVESFYGIDANDDRVYIFPTSAIAQPVSFRLPTGLTNPLAVTIDGEYLYIVDNAGDEVFVVPADTPKDQRATVTRRFDLPTDLTTPSGMTISGTDLYIVDNAGDEVFVVPADTANNTRATVTRRFDLPTDLTTPSAMVIDGNDLYIIDNRSIGGQRRIHVVPANTANNTRATRSRRFKLPGGVNDPRGMTIIGSELYVLNATSTTDWMRVYPKNTANTKVASTIRSFQLPSGFNDPQGLAHGARNFSVQAEQQNHLNFAFDVTATGDLYFALVVQSIDSRFSTLIIKRRASDGTETTVLSDKKTLTSLTDLEATGGVYLGVQECLYHNNYLYLTVPIQRLDSDGETPPTYTPSRSKAAGMVLYRVATNAATPTLTVLEKWDFVQNAACNLTVHNGAVHFVESPAAGTVFKPVNSDLDTYNTDMGYNVLPESLGALKKVSSTGAIEELGNLWHTDRPFNVAATRCLSFGGDLHLIMGYGNLDEVLRYNSLASGADNMAHIVYGKTLHYVLPNFQPRGSVYAALADIAKSVNAVLSFRQNVVVISDRRPFRALTDGATGTGTGDLSFDTANKTFPESGYLFIGKEILKYTGISSGAFTGITRGVLGSAIANHADNSEILYLDNLIQSKNLGSPYKAITLQSDTNRIFNVIRDSAGVAEVRDEESIARYGERPYTLDLGLTRHEKAWIEEVFASYLAELKDLQSIVNIQVVPDFSLRLGQIVPFVYAGDIRVMRIVSVRYEARSTHIKGRTL